MEVFDPEGSETRGMPRYLGDKEQPLVVKRDWTKRGRFFLCNRVGSSSEALLDALNVYLQQVCSHTTLLGLSHIEAMFVSC